MDWVLDSSLALAWALPDENSGQAEEVFFSVADGDLFYVPSLRNAAEKAGVKTNSP